MSVKSSNNSKQTPSIYPYILFNSIEYDDAIAGKERYFARIIEFNSLENNADLITNPNNKDFKPLCSSREGKIPFCEKVNDNILSLEICKNWNDEAYIKLYVELCKWKRKDTGPEHQIHIQYLEEVKRKFDAWYLENKYDTPNLYNYILQMREQIDVLVKNRNIIKSEINILEQDVVVLEKQFEKDVTEFPPGLKNELHGKENEIKIKQDAVCKIEMQLWGVQGKSEGLYWKHGRYEDEYKKINLNDDGLYNKLLDNTNDRKYRELEQEIKIVLSANNIRFSEEELADLCLNTLEFLIDEEIIYGKKEVNISSAVSEVLKSRYNIDSPGTDDLLSKPVIKKEIPSKELIKICMETYKSLLDNDILSIQDKESRLNKIISTRVINKLEEEYILSERNKGSISDYFRKGQIIAKKNSKGEIIVKKV